MTSVLHLALASLNPDAGAPRANAALIRAARAEAARQGATLLVTPQGSLSGHALLDLPRDASFQAACLAVVGEMAVATADGGPAVLLGAPAREGDQLHDMLFLLGEGRILARRARHAVPDRAEPFDPGPAPGPVAWGGLRLGLMVGADLADASVAETLAESGADLLLCAGASPVMPCEDRTQDLAVARVVESGLPLAWVGPWGGQGEEVFAGGGFVLNTDRSLAAAFPPFGDMMAITGWHATPTGWHCAPTSLAPQPPPEARLLRAIGLGIADLVRKGGWSRAAVMPGPAAALVAACAADALGAGRVIPVAEGQPLPLDALPLHGMDRTAFLLGDTPFGHGFAPLKGLYASTVSALARARGVVAPGADAATDAILQALADEDQTIDATVARGFPREDVVALWRRMRAGGYKRRQAPPGLAFGRGRDRLDPLTFSGLTDPIS